LVQLCVVQYSREQLRGAVGLQATRIARDKMQRRVRVSEVEALASDEHRAELTPMFWQGTVVAFGTLVVTILVFVILCFSQMAQNTGKLQRLIDYKNPQTAARCMQSESTEWFIQRLMPLKYIASFAPPGVDKELWAKMTLTNGDYDDDWTWGDCGPKTEATCGQTDLAEVYTGFQSVASGIMRTYQEHGLSSICSEKGAGISYGIFLDMLCQNAAEESTPMCFSPFPHACQYGLRPYDSTRAQELVMTAIKQLPSRCEWRIPTLQEEMNR